MTKRNTISTTYLQNINDLDNEFDWNEFSIQTPTHTIDSNSFELIAIGTPNKEKESWNMEIKSDKYNTIEDLIYILVIKNKIFKIGKSITTMSKRIASYHCGKNAYREKENATNSATNWFVLQSVLAINEPVYIYALYIPQTQNSFMGWTYNNRVSKEIETKLLSEFNKKYLRSPIGNKQK